MSGSPSCVCVLMCGSEVGRNRDRENNSKRDEEGHCVCQPPHACAGAKCIRYQPPEAKCLGAPKDFRLPSHASALIAICGPLQVLRNYYHPRSTPYDKRCDIYSLVCPSPMCRCVCASASSSQPQSVRLGTIHHDLLAGPPCRSWQPRGRPRCRQSRALGRELGPPFQAACDHTVPCAPLRSFLACIA